VTALPAIKVALEPPYRVHVGWGDTFIQAQLEQALAGASAIAIISDDAVNAQHHPSRVAQFIDKLGLPHQLFTVPAGEASKSAAQWALLLEQLATARFDRQALVVAVGGGVVGDLAGFVAASYLRGVAVVQMPTTLLAMVDASIGGKSGINLTAGKNLAGAFWQPRRVIADVATLRTLPEANFREGAVELYKHALLVDAPWRSAFHQGASFGLPRSSDAELAELIHAGILVKAEVVSRDPLERGERAHLNLGHTLAHALEGVTHGRMRHGTAVAYGLVFAAQLSVAAGYRDWTEDAVALARWAADASLPDVPWEALTDFIDRDKKRAHGRLRWIVLEEPGRPRIIDAPEPHRLAEHWTALRDRF